MRKWETEDKNFNRFFLLLKYHFLSLMQLYSHLSDQQVQVSIFNMLCIARYSFSSCVIVTFNILLYSNMKID